MVSLEKRNTKGELISVSMEFRFWNAKLVQSNGKKKAILRFGPRLNFLHAAVTQEAPHNT